MVKTIVIFRKCCLELLELTEIRDTLNFEELFSTKMKDNKYLYYQQPDYRKKINELADYLLEKRKGTSTNYSREYLLKSIDDFLFNLKFDSIGNKSQKIDEFFNSSEKLFKENTTYIITRQIVNLFLDSEFSIGKVTFIPYSREKHASIYLDGGVQKEYLDRLLHQENDGSVGCIAKLEVSASDYEKALELSDFFVDESLDIIRFYFRDTNFGMRGALSPLQTYATICDKKTLNMCAPLRNKNIKLPINLKLNWIEDLKNNYGLANVDNILKKEALNRTDVEENLIISIKYFSEALKYRENSEKIIRLFTGLETLLLDVNEQKKYNLAERLSSINYSDESKKEDVYNSVVNLYEKRSKLVHNGVSDYKEKEFRLLLNESYLCIVNVAKRIEKYPKFSDWKNLFETAKSSGKFEYL